ncbi:MAG: hypothetical protein AMXMBFR59_19810 [Rhodanobacteraceae bacterium]
MSETVNPQITDATAFPTAVNAQITDAVTQANVKVLAESPAMAMSAIYQSLAQSTGILFENAVSQQQQQYAAAQAATNQGIIQIYSVDTLSDATAIGRLAQTSSAQIDATQAPHEGVRKAMAHLNSQITEAVNFSNATNLAHGGDVAYGVRCACDALASSIERINHVTQKNLLESVKLAARAACLAGMVRDPDKVSAYQDVLSVIDALD